MTIKINSVLAEREAVSTTTYKAMMATSGLWKKSTDEYTAVSFHGTLGRDPLKWRGIFDVFMLI